MHLFHRRLCGGLCCLVGSWATLAASAHGSGITQAANTLALTGTDGFYGPGLGPGVRFAPGDFVVPEFNRSGQWIMWAGVGESGSTTGIWTGSGNNNQPTFLPQSPVPGMSGARFFSYEFTDRAIAPDGALMFQASITGASQPEHNVRTWIEVTPSLSQSTVIARRLLSSGPPPAQHDPIAFTSIDTYRTSSPRWVGFRGDNSTGTRMWLGQPGSLRSVAVAGQPAPGSPAGTVLGTNLYAHAINEAGQLAFGSNLQSTSGAQQGTGLYLADAVATTMVATSTGQAPGQPAGTTFGSISNTAISLAGQVAFSCNVGAYFGTPGALRLAVGIGLQAPGFTRGVQFVAVNDPIAVGANWFAFNTNVGPSGGTPTNCLYLDRGQGHGPELIVREGQTVPGAGPNVFIQGPGASRASALGQILLETPLRGSFLNPLNSTNNMAVMVWDPSLGLVPIARLGDTLTVGDGSVRTIAHLSDITLGVLDPGSPIPGSSLFAPASNPIGFVAYQARFTDGSSGVFTAVVPAPSALPIVIASVLLARRRSRAA